MKKNDKIGDEFQGNAINDKRIMKRLKMTGEQLFQTPTGSIPQACEGIADMKGAYRLFDNKKVTPEGILAGHRESTITRINQHAIILLIQDTTKFDYSGHPSVDGLGLYSCFEGNRGILLHTTLAITTDGVPLGIMDQKYWIRPIEERGKKHERKKLPTEKKESNRWIESLKKSTKGITGTFVKAVTIADREADIYDLFKSSMETKQDILIRAVGTRRVDGEEKILIESVKSSEIAGQIRIRVPRNSNEKKKEREVTLDIKYCPVQIKPPMRRGNDKTLLPINLNAIFAQEPDVAEGENAIQWLLLTSLAVSNLEDAVEKINWYKQRWKIERFHFTLKSGCKVEKLQLETVDRLENAISLYSIIAWKLIWLTHESREHPDDSCERVLEKHEWQSLFCMVNKNPNPPNVPPTLKEAVLMISKLGGFIGRKGDGNPGIMVMWRGLQRLNDIAAVWFFLRPPPGLDVGND